MEAESGCEALAERNREDDLLVGGAGGLVSKEVVAEVLAELELAAVDDGVASADAVLPVGGTGVNLGVDVGPGEEGISGPLVHQAVLSATLDIGKGRNSLVEFLDHEIEYLGPGSLGGKLLGRFCHERSVSPVVHHDVVIEGTEGPELGDGGGLSAAVKVKLVVFHLLQRIVAETDTSPGSVPCRGDFSLLGVPGMVVHTTVTSTVIPTC